MMRMNRHSFLFSRTCKFICSGSQSLFFFLCQLECLLLKYLLLMSRYVVCINFVLHIPVGFQIPVCYVMPHARPLGTVINQA